MNVTGTPAGQFLNRDLVQVKVVFLTCELNAATRAKP